MQSMYLARRSARGRTVVFVLALLSLFVGLFPGLAQALPTFARQTGQNCVACHTGGQYPELTPYGRMFKMTGYTIGERTMPLSVMAVASYASVANTDKSDTADAGISTTNSGSDFYKNNEPILATGSLFVAGKISENLGAFVQITHDPYAVANADGSASGHTQADNMDFRFADRVINEQRDLIYGVSLNNNPSVTDPWNTAAAWMQYVPVPSPSSHQFVDGTAPYPGTASGGNVAGITAYAYLNKTWYGELGFYGTADGAFRLFREGMDDSEITRLQGYNPYWRLAWTREWGAQNLMLGATGMLARVYDGQTISDPSNSDSYNQVRTTGIDAQYQYILDPHTFTAQLAYTQQLTNYSANTMLGGSSFVQADGSTPVAPFSSSDTVDTIRLKLAYTWMARYGGSLSVFDRSGTTSTNQQTSGYDPTGAGITSDPAFVASQRVGGNLAGNPGTRGMTWEAFYMPMQNLRIGAQYTAYSTFNGASSNYDGFGRDASDNNTLFLYAWLAF